jgi:hypothetical protein
MKLAGFLALALALILGGWTISDYFQNEDQAQVNGQELRSEISRNYDEIGSGRPLTNTAMDRRKEIDAAFQFDGIMGIVSGCVLIGSVALLSQAKKRAA